MEHYHPCTVPSGSSSVTTSLPASKSILLNPRTLHLSTWTQQKNWCLHKPAKPPRITDYLFYPYNRSNKTLIQSAQKSDLNCTLCWSNDLNKAKTTTLAASSLWQSSNFLLPYKHLLPSSISTSRKQQQTEEYFQQMQAHHLDNVSTGHV